MKVRATELGYGGLPRHQLRQVGDVFDVRDGSKDSWYEPVKKGEVKAAAADEDNAEDLA